MQGWAYRKSEDAVRGGDKVPDEVEGRTKRGSSAAQLSPHCPEGPPGLQQKRPAAVCQGPAPVSTEKTRTISNQPVPVRQTCLCPSSAPGPVSPAQGAGVSSFPAHPDVAQVLLPSGSPDASARSPNAECTSLHGRRPGLMSTWNPHGRLPAAQDPGSLLLGLQWLSAAAGP